MRSLSHFHEPDGPRLWLRSGVSYQQPDYERWCSKSQASGRKHNCEHYHEQNLYQRRSVSRPFATFSVLHRRANAARCPRRPERRLQRRRERGGQRSNLLVPNQIQGLLKSVEFCCFQAIAMERVAHPCLRLIEFC